LPPTPSIRIRAENNRPIDASGDFVLYWMTAARRTRFNFALQRAVELSEDLGRPLAILEALDVDYPFASDRLHAFVIDGMRANARAAAAAGARYYPYIEPGHGARRGLLQALAASAAVVVTDWFPAPRAQRVRGAAARLCRVRLEAVDSTGLIPVAAHERAFPTARGYRAFVQRTLRSHLAEFPEEEPLGRVRTPPPALPSAITTRWPAADLASPTTRTLSALPIDHSVSPAATGGADVAQRALGTFVRDKLVRYGDESNDPDADVTSRLSPYLHFGHVSAHEIFSAVMTSERWTTRRLGQTRAGARRGWWGTSPGAEHFLEQLVVWRELAFNGSARLPGFERYETLPAWARGTLEAHLDDPRPRLYSLEQLDAAETHDELWNAAQRQLRREGWCHGYMRMLWGKKILEWSRHPADALDRMAHLMDRYSLDGRDPVSYLNYGWVLGRYDRPWPERPIFGTVRCMTSESARRKLEVKSYLARYG